LRDRKSRKASRRAKAPLREAGCRARRSKQSAPRGDRKARRTITLLEAPSEKSVRTPTYSEAAKTGLQQTVKSQKITVSPSQKKRSSIEVACKDERAVSIDTGRTKAEKADLAQVKERLQDGLDKAKVTEGLKIEFLRPSTGQRIEVVFMIRNRQRKNDSDVEVLENGSPKYESDCIVVAMCR
jgi:flagellar motility protein MotE (MotC chaperone)